MMSARVNCFAVAAVVFLTSSIAQEPAKAPPPRNPDRQEMMQEMMKMMMPSEGHKPFAKMTGKWTAKMKIWNSAAMTQPPMESTEETECKLVLGGRFLVEEAKGKMFGMPSERLSLLGYDNYTKKYTQVFYSSMGTATNVAEGVFDANGKVLTLRGVFDDPSGKYPFKNVIRLDSDDLHTFESYKIHPDGTESKIIEGMFTRAK
jgi:hypothetical protein